MKYLHFMTDHFYSTKFIDIIQSKFNPQEHFFIIIQKKNKKNYINPLNYQNIKMFTISREKKVLKFIILQIRFFTWDNIRIRKLMKQAEYIFIHNLTEEISGLLFTFKGSAKILWVMWGVDLYDYIPLNLFDNYTSKLMVKLDNKIISMLLKFYYSFFYEIRKAVIRRLDYVISTHKGDLRLLKKYFKTKAKWFSEAIYPNPVDFEKIEAEVSFYSKKKYDFKKKTEKLLLLGNSGAPTNNHLDIMIRLSKMKEQNFKIICPLSYGPPNYIKKIIKKGKILFSDRFVPLIEFLEPGVYYQILKQIDLAIMYHNRQQGVGTINILLYLGKLLCMKKTSSLYHLIEKGVSVFPAQDIEKLILNGMEFTTAMSEKNRKIILQNQSVKSVISSINNLFNILEDKNDR